MNSARTTGVTWPLLTAAALSLIWVPSLARGFCDSDFSLVPLGFSDFDFSTVGGGRPVRALSFALLPAHAFLQHALNLILYLACLWLLWRLCRRLNLGPWATFAALSSLFHPAFLWAVTWISEREDTQVLFFLLSAVMVSHVPIKVALIALGSGIKPPMFVQNVVFAFQFARQRQFLASAASLLCIVVFGVIGYLGTYVGSAGGDTLANASVGLLIAAPLRIAKMLEGILWIFAPIPMFTIGPWGPLAAFLAYGALWIVVLRSLKPSRFFETGTGWVPAMAVSLWVPFVFASEVRNVAVAAALAFLAIAIAVKWDRPRQLALVAILALNVTGSLLNYGVVQSNVYDIRAQRIFLDYSQPVYVYQGWRETMRKRVLTAFGINADRVYPPYLNLPR